MAVADLKIRARTKLNIELIKEYIRARRLPEQILTRESLAEGAIYRTGEELQDYQLRILRNTFRELVRKEVDEAVQRHGQQAGPVGFDRPARLFSLRCLRCETVATIPRPTRRFEGRRECCC